MLNKNKNRYLACAYGGGLIIAFLWSFMRCLLVVLVGFWYYCLVLCV